MSKKITQQELLDSIHKLSKLAKQAESKAFSNGLTLPQCRALIALGKNQTLPQKEIGRYLMCSQGNVSMIIGRLEKKDLVKKIRSDQDGRVGLIELTPAGYSLAKKLIKQSRIHVKEFMEELGGLALDIHAHLNPS